MSFIDARLSRRNQDQHDDSSSDPGANWKRIGPIVRRIVSRLNVPTPTAIVIAEAAGFPVETD